MKKLIEDEKIKKINEENEFIQKLKKIGEKALKKKTLQEKGILSNNGSINSNMSFTTNSSGLKDSSFSHNKGSISTKIPNTERKTYREKTDHKERFDWMIKKSDNFFAEY